ncbi:MAG TPA: hypothetical protein VGN93_19290 [Shinella sp.]|jgi:hypothetical protein|uniref:hypothetical protein n=1 Tax=Shinella sp. TaxID=1870904 RepID=UPI002E12993E|nr:hypothetical protein [Shinella sp.]
MKGTVTTVELPPRSLVLAQLAALAEGTLSPDDASKWAETWLLADQVTGADLRIEDWPVWKAIKLLAGADLQTEPGSYLHGTDDFRGWLENLSAAPLPHDRSAPHC